MSAGRTILPAIATAGFLIAAQAQLAAQSAGPPQASHDRQAPAAAPGPAQSSTPEGGAQKPAVEPGAEAPKRTEDAAPSLTMVSILGREITNREGDSGRVIDVLVDVDGRLSAVVVEFGGFMGIGSRKVAVDWGALRFVREGNRHVLTVDISRDQIRDTPEYKPNEPPSVIKTK